MHRDTQRQSSLTYEPFYRLLEKPFSLSADPRFLFRSTAHGPAFDELLTGIQRREGLIVLTGEIGTGKTTLCRSVLDHLDRRTFAAFVPDPFVSREDLLKTLLVDFGVVAIGDLTSGRFTGATRTDLSFLLYEFLDSLAPLQAVAVLVIDEAQNLPVPLLEEIRILSELERREKLLQVVLVGQPELRTKLKLPEMRQVDQRVSVRCELKPLAAGAVAGYVNHRLQIAGGGEQTVEFTSEALAFVFKGSAGVPRLINRICDRALQRAYKAGSVQIAAHFVWAALDDLGLSETAFLPAPVVPVAPVAPVVPVAPVSAPREIDVRDDALPARNALERSVARRDWMTWAAAAILVVVAGLGGPAWYAHAQEVNEPVAMLPLPPPLPRTVPMFVEMPRVDDAAAGGYTIVVATFKSSGRAEQVAGNLTTAGFGAHAVERDGGPERGRFFVVLVSGYTSALDAQRDLQQIRTLPGGYTDARIADPE